MTALADALGQLQRPEYVRRLVRLRGEREVCLGLLMQYCRLAIQGDAEAISWVNSPRFMAFGRDAGMRVSVVEDLRDSVLEAARDPHAKRGADLVLRNPEALERMRARGLSAADIAAELGASSRSVERAIKRHTRGRAA